MSSSQTSTRPTKVSSSRTPRSTVSGNATASSIPPPSSTTSNLGSTSTGTSVTGFTPATSAGETTTSANTVSATNSTNSAVPVGNASNNAPKSPVVIIVVGVILGVLLLGLVAFLLRKFLARRRPLKEPYALKHEPKHEDSYPQLAVPDATSYLPVRIERNGNSTTQSRGYSLGSVASASKPIPRSSRASSSIVHLDDDMSTNSRSSFLRPLSFGESTTSLTLRGMQMAYGSQTQLSTLYENQGSKSADLESQSTLSLATPRRGDMSDDEEKTPIESSHIFTFTQFEDHNSSPVPLVQTPSPSPVPFVHRSFDAAASRNSYNTLSPSRRVRSMSVQSRPESMVSVYSTQTQNQATDVPATLEPDVLVALDRLKKRVSAPWSFTSVDSYRANRTTIAITEEA